MSYRPNVQLTALATVDPKRAREIIQAALMRGFQSTKAGGTTEHAARELGVGHNTLRRLMLKLKIRAPGDRRRWVKSQEKKAI